MFLPCLGGRYVVLPRPVCFEKGMNYTVRLELPQYTASGSDVESPYTFIDSVSTRLLSIREPSRKCPAATPVLCGGTELGSEAEWALSASRASLCIAIG